MIERTQLRSGSLRHRVKFQQRRSVADGRGGFTEAWITYQEARASLRLERGGEEFLAQGIKPRKVWRVVVAYFRRLPSESDRILWGDRELEIASVEDIDGRGRWYQIQAMEQV